VSVGAYCRTLCGSSDRCQVRIAEHCVIISYPQHPPSSSCPCSECPSFAQYSSTPYTLRRLHCMYISNKAPFLGPPVATRRPIVVLDWSRHCGRLSAQSERYVCTSLLPNHSTCISICTSVCCCVLVAAVLQNSERDVTTSRLSGTQRCVVEQVAVDVSKDCGAVSHSGPLEALLVFETSPNDAPSCFRTPDCPVAPL
jgi:hypothetical protein